MSSRLDPSARVQLSVRHSDPPTEMSHDDEGNVHRPDTVAARAELDQLSDDELLVRFRALPRESDERAVACEILVARYQKLVRSCVRQYQSSPESAEELMQVGYVGLIKAINNFDPDIGGSLSGLRVSPA